MYDFAIKIKGNHSKNLIGFFDCSFVGFNINDIKLDFIIKFSEFMTLYAFDYNYLINKSMTKEMEKLVSNRKTCLNIRFTLINSKTVPDIIEVMYYK